MKHTVAVAFAWKNVEKERTTHAGARARGRYHINKMAKEKFCMEMNAQRPRTEEYVRIHIYSYILSLTALMLNNIKPRECIAVNLLENSFSRLWRALFSSIRISLCARSLNLFLCFCCSCALLSPSSSSSHAIEKHRLLGQRLHAILRVYKFTCMPV